MTMGRYKIIQEMWAFEWKRRTVEVEASTKDEAKRNALYLMGTDWTPEEVKDMEWTDAQERDINTDSIMLYMDDAEVPFAISYSSDEADFTYPVNLWRTANEAALVDIRRQGLPAGTEVDVCGNCMNWHDSENRWNILVLAERRHWESLPIRYTFGMSRDELVKECKPFRKQMRKYLLSFADGHLADVVEKWYAGKLDEEDWPFDEEEVIEVWGHEAIEKKEYKATKLVGFELVNQKGEYPEGYDSSVIYKDLDHIREISENMAEPCLINALYEDDLE